ncbi:MAG: T9SS type A sorting domain-containing protein, partial [Flavobacteriales bacterium]|nr:T9SS type A sorting domain-containing protein [Flavobacteriales bacterium]
PTSGPLATDGSASVTQVINGAPPYTYMWSNGGSNTTINNIGVGSYYVVVSDTLGCRDTTYVNIWDSCLLTLSGVVTDASVPGASDGAIDVTVSGASSPVFLWSNLATTEDLNNIPQGIYTVYVDDSLGCADSMTFIVGAASCNLQVLGNITNESSFGANDGAISVSVSNGIAPYTYSWSNGASSSSLSNLAPGSYILTVMDSVGCMVIDTFDVLPFLCKQMSIDSVLIINSTGPTGTNGSIHLIVSGTPGPFSYLWSNGQTGSSLTNVAAGNYCVTITDDSVGCIIDTCYSVGQDSCNMSLTSQVNHESGPSANDGSIILTPVGGTAPYSYSWSPNVFNNSSGANNLTPGVYSYTITDDAGCQAIGYDTINDFCDLSVTGIAYPTIPNQSNGWIDITVSGGAAPYVYTWSPGGQTTEDISGLDIGNYNVQVRDSNGCVVNALFGVEASPLSIEELGTVDRFNVYPNPTSDMINVRLLSSTGKGIYKINIRNMLGELLFSDIRYISNEAMTFDISLLQSGLYLMEFDDQKNYQTVVPIILK